MPGVLREGIILGFVFFLKIKRPPRLPEQRRTGGPRGEEAGGACAPPGSGGRRLQREQPEPPRPHSSHRHRARSGWARPACRSPGGGSCRRCCCCGREPHRQPLAVAFGREGGKRGGYPPRGGLSGRRPRAASELCKHRRGGRRYLRGRGWVAPKFPPCLGTQTGLAPSSGPTSGRRSGKVGRTHHPSSDCISAGGGTVRDGGVWRLPVRRLWRHPALSWGKTYPPPAGAEEFRLLPTGRGVPEGRVCRSVCPPARGEGLRERRGLPGGVPPAATPAGRGRGVGGPSAGAIAKETTTGGDEILCLESLECTWIYIYMRKKIQVDWKDISVERTQRTFGF